VNGEVLNLPDALTWEDREWVRTMLKKADLNFDPSTDYYHRLTRDLIKERVENDAFLVNRRAGGRV
jgi:hypothetical protein